jgi:2-iminobutanoate/2-iminopropanoate deaminase
MSSKQRIEQPGKQASTGAYSAGILVDGWLHVSGQGPIDLETGQVVSGTIEQETRHTLENVVRVVQAAGGSRDDIVKCQVHLNDISQFDRFNAAYAEFFGDTVLPARTTVGSNLPGIKIEIDAVARIDSAR